MKNAIIRSAALSFGMALGFAPLALAQQEQKQQDIPHPCAADAERLCQGVPVGGGAQMACLKSHKSELSPQCKMKILKAAEKKEQEKMNMPQGQQPQGEPTPNPTP
jgi:hypothetical protein